MRINEKIRTEDFDSEKSLNSSFGNKSKTEKIVLAILLAMAVLIWLPRLEGPIDLRWDGGVYYILGTSLAEGKGYKLLNEPGEIDAMRVQLPNAKIEIIEGGGHSPHSESPSAMESDLVASQFLESLR